MNLFLVIIASGFVGALGSYVYVSNKMSLLTKKLYTDKLTGIKNTNYFDDFFGKHLRSNTSYILIDIDNFKEYNTQFGYDVADKLLLYFVDMVKKKLQTGDEILRYKFGDEFLIILNNKTSDDAVLFLAGLKKGFDSEPWMEGEKKLHLFFSSGITTFTERATQKFIIDQLMKSLLAAKKQKNKNLVA